MNDDIIFYGYLTLTLTKDDAKVYYINNSYIEKITEYDRATTYLQTPNFPHILSLISSKASPNISQCFLLAGIAM